MVKTRKKAGPVKSSKNPAKTQTKAGGGEIAAVANVNRNTENARSVRNSKNKRKDRSTDSQELSSQGHNNGKRARMTTTELSASQTMSQILSNLTSLSVRVTKKWISV